MASIPSEIILNHVDMFSTTVGFRGLLLESAVRRLLYQLRIGFDPIRSRYKGRRSHSHKNSITVYYNITILLIISYLQCMLRFNLTAGRSIKAISRTVN